MQLLLLTIDRIEDGKPVQISYEPWGDVFVYINTKDTIPVSPDVFNVYPPKHSFCIDASREGYGKFHLVTSFHFRDYNE